jgi:hypothetical protein
LLAAPSCCPPYLACCSLMPSKCQDCHKTLPSWGMPGGKKKWCAGCAKSGQHDGAVDLVNAKCEDCHKTLPSWGMPGGKRKWCAGCAKSGQHDGAVDLVSRMCERCGIRQGSFSFGEGLRGSRVWCGACKVAGNHHGSTSRRNSERPKHKHTGLVIDLSAELDGPARKSDKVQNNEEASAVVVKQEPGDQTALSLMPVPESRKRRRISARRKPPQQITELLEDGESVSAVSASRDTRPYTEEELNVMHANGHDVVNCPGTPMHRCLFVGGCWHVYCAEEHAHCVEGERFRKTGLHFCRFCSVIMTRGDDFHGKCPQCKCK